MEQDVGPRAKERGDGTGPGVAGEPHLDLNRAMEKTQVWIEGEELRVCGLAFCSRILLEEDTGEEGESKKKLMVTV